MFAGIDARPMKKFVCSLLLAAGVLVCAGAQPAQLSVRDFLRLSPGDTASYVVSGVVSKIRSSSSGSFWIEDGSGTLLVYGIQDPRNPARSFRQLDIARGDTLSVLGRFTIYGGTTKEMKDGRLLRKADGPDHHLSFYERLEQQPSFKGKAGEAGLEAFRQWAQDRVRQTADGARGSVKLRFVVGRNGGVQEVQVLEGTSAALNAAALRVLGSAPKWKPGKADGAPVRVPYTLSLVL